MIIKVLGAGCSSCKQLHKMVEKSVKELGIDCKIEYITDIQKIVILGVMQTPALIIGNEIVVSGYVPENQELKEIIKKHFNKLNE